MYDTLSGRLPADQKTRRLWERDCILNDRRLHPVQAKRLAARV